MEDGSSVGDRRACPIKRVALGVPNSFCNSKHGNIPPISRVQGLLPEGVQRTHSPQ